MSLITRNAKEYRSMTAQEMSENLPNRSLRNFLSSSRHHYLPIPRGPCSSKSRFFSAILTVYYNCKYFPWYTRELLECHLGIEPAGAIIPPLPVSSERVCKSASLQVCKSASLRVCRSASLQVWGLQVCSLRLSHTEDQSVSQCSLPASSLRKSPRRF